MDLDEIAKFEFNPRMSDVDSLMWDIEKDPLLRSTIIFVTVLDQPPDRDRFRWVMDKASRTVPRLRQRVLGHPLSIAPPRWEVDPNFDLDYHLRWMKAAGPGTLREVFAIAEPIGMQGFDRARPLWEMTVVEGLDDGKAALIGKVHHSITDGIGGMKLQMEMLDLERDPGTHDELPPAPQPRHLSEPRRFFDAMIYEAGRQLGNARSALASAVSIARRAVEDPVSIATEATRTASSIGRLMRPAAEPMSPLMRGRSLSVRYDSLQVPLRDLKAAAKVVAGRLNDAFVAAVAGGMRRYHQHHGYDIGVLRMTMPINIRGTEDTYRVGNRFVPARFPVPVDIDDPIARMNAIRELVAGQRSEPALALTEPLAHLLNRLPATATTAFFGSMLKGVDFITSNVPGSPVPVYVAGARVEAQIALGPMSGAAANITLLSYVDDANIGINTDPAAIEDPEVFVECLRDGFDEITKLA
ncbi:MAG: wax ester/triacylglycerol synthase family O-acyltransferase [Acidimicrobiales bacterium]|nr:wax ester/triacylglycerol synthase family O-acyltransferase [Acidimicrobiales bacterium]